MNNNNISGYTQFIQRPLFGNGSLIDVNQFAFPNLEESKPSKTLREVWNEYLDKCRCCKSKQRVKELTYQFNSFGDLISCPVDKIHTSDILAFSESDYSFSWRSKQVKLLRALLRMALKKGYVDEDVTENVIVRNSEDSDRSFHDYLDNEKMQLVLEHADENYSAYADMFRLSYLTGMRLGEVRILKHSYIDYDCKRIVIPASKAKKRKRDVIFIGKSAIDLLKNQEKMCDYIFPNPQTLEPYSKKQPSKIAVKILKSLGLYHKGVGGHIFRKSFITNLVMNCVPLEQVQKLARHTDPEITTKYYIRYCPKYLSDVLDRVT